MNLSKLTGLLSGMEIVITEMELRAFARFKPSQTSHQ